MYYDGAYAPFGEPYAQSGTTDLSFTGMNQDTVAGLYDFPAREYGIQGRWPSPDPAGLAAVDPMNPQSWNRYAYVLNNPIDCVDPSGLCEHMLYDDASCFAGGFFGASNWPTVWEASDSWDWGYYPILWADGGGSPSRPAATPPQSVPPSPQSGSPPWSLSPWQIWGPFGTTIPCDFGACLPIGNPFTGQVGVSVGWTFWGINFNLFAGLAIDLHGHLAIYHGSGQGVATGARASGGVQFEVSNANTVSGPRGPFGNASGTAGLDGLAGTGDVFWGKGDGPGGTVTGGGVTLGVGGGGSASAGRTSTTVSPINGPGCPK
jgi:RHS repeat-associated protein